MQIRALLGSLHVIEVQRLSVDSMENITWLTLPVVMNRTNTVKKMWLKCTSRFVQECVCRAQVRARTVHTCVGLCVRRGCSACYTTWQWYKDECKLAELRGRPSSVRCQELWRSGGTWYFWLPRAQSDRKQCPGVITVFVSSLHIMVAGMEGTLVGSDTTAPSGITLIPVPLWSLFVHTS